jgi:hypothetical protein
MLENIIYSILQTPLFQSGLFLIILAVGIRKVLKYMTGEFDMISGEYRKYQLLKEFGMYSISEAEDSLWKGEEVCVEFPRDGRFVRLKKVGDKFQVLSFSYDIIYEFEWVERDSLHLQTLVEGYLVLMYPKSTCEKLLKSGFVII